MNPAIIKSYIKNEITKLNLHPNQFNLLKGFKGKKQSTNLYMYLPAIYASPFRYENIDIIKQLCFSSYLYYLSIIYLDKILDNQIENSLEIKNQILLSQTLQSHAIQTLNNIFEIGSKFWVFFNLRNSEWLDSVYNEYDQDFDLTITNYSKHVISKVCIGKLSIDAIYILKEQKDTLLYHRLIDLYEMFYISYQILDDIDDFDEDYENNQINIAKDITLKLINSQKLELINKKEIKSTFYLYVFNDIINYSIQNIEQCINALEKENLPFILMRAKKLLNNLCSKKESFAKFINENNPNKPLIKRENIKLNRELKLSLEYIVANWETGFYKLKHKMHFSPKHGFKSRPLQVGDIFQRAIIVTHLKTIINNTEAYELEDIIKFEKEYLKNNKYSEAGWKYFPNLLELPCDSDDLAQIMHAFTGSNKEELEFLFKTSLIELFKSSKDLFFKTWIYSFKTHEIERQSTKNEWGDTYDVDVISNIGHAIMSNLDDLNFLIRSKILEVLKKNATFVCDRQHKNGYWESTWYDDIYYGTYVCTRFLNNFQQHSDSVNKAMMFLKNTQNENGSWGNLKKKNLLNTSLVLLTFYETRKEELYIEAIIKGADYILSNRNIDGSYSSDNFIKMEVGRSNDKPGKIVYYKSDVLTTSYCLTALSYVYGKEI